MGFDERLRGDLSRYPAEVCPLGTSRFLPLPEYLDRMAFKCVLRAIREPKIAVELAVDRRSNEWRGVAL